VSQIQTSRAQKNHQSRENRQREETGGKTSDGTLPMEANGSETQVSPASNSQRAEKGPQASQGQNNERPVDVAMERLRGNIAESVLTDKLKRLVNPRSNEGRTQKDKGEVNDENTNGPHGLEVKIRLRPRKLIIFAK